MGMFDEVVDGDKPLTIPCPRCGEPVTGFQSKEGPCELRQIDWRQLRRFYTSCDACKNWVDIEVDPPKVTVQAYQQRGVRMPRVYLLDLPIPATVAFPSLVLKEPDDGG